MSETGFVYPEVPPAQKSPIIVRVVDNTPVRSLQKLNIVSVEEPEDDVLTDAYDTMVAQAAEEYLAKQIEELNSKETNDVEGGRPDPEVEQLLEAVIDDEGEYVREPKLDPITKEYISAQQASQPHPTGEALMTSDKDDMSAEYYYDDIDPVATFLPDVPEKYIAKTNEENMKDESYTGQQAGAKQASEKGTLDFLRSVEGRVLTVLEAALPDKEHRNAVKSLIKKEFRREMNRVNRVGSEEDE